jgi:hypothetical protein
MKSVCGMNKGLKFESARVMNAFLITKLETVDEVIPTLKGLLRLSSMSTYMASDCREAVEQ